MAYKKYIQPLLLVTLICTVLFFGFFTEEKTVESFALTVAICLIYSIIIGGGNLLLNEELDRRFSWASQTRRRAIYGIICTIILNVVLVLVCNYINFVVLQGEEPSLFFSGYMNFIHWLTINISLLISAVLHARGFMVALQRTTRSQVVEQKLIAKTANAQFESLKNQLDPHFLFNSLNVLSSLIDENTESAQEFTSSMSKVYRYVLEQKDKELVSVEEELEFARTYSELLKTRFEDSVNFDFNVQQEDLKAFVVPLSLQLLLENCIKHNFATEAKPLRAKISSNGESLCIENNFQPRELAKERQGIGLANIVQRYSLLTKRNVYIEKSDESFQVKIPLLKEKISTMKSKELTDLTAYERASKRVEELKGFYGNLISFCIFIPFLFFINWRTAPEYWWAFWPLLGWGIGVIFHAIQTFGIGREWEEKQIRKYMEKEEESNSKWN